GCEAFRDQIRDSVCIVNASSPAAAGRFLKRSPKARVGGNVRVAYQMVALRTSFEFGSADGNDVDRTLEATGVDAQANSVAVADLADLSAGPRRGADAPDAGTGRYTGKTTVGDQRDPLT